MKHYEKEFTVAGVKLKCKKLGLADFPTFKMLYGNAINDGNAEGLTKAYMLLFSWIEHEMLPGEWVPAFNKKTEEFTVAALNTVVASNQIADLMIAEVLVELFQNTGE